MKSRARGPVNASRCAPRPDRAAPGGTVRARASAKRGSPARHLVLEPPDVGVLRRQLDRFGRRQDRLDGVLGLTQGRFPRIDLEREDRGQARLHLRDGVALQDVDRHRPVLRVAEHRGLLLVLVAERHDDVGLVHVTSDHDRQLQIADRLFEPLAADALRQDTERRQWRASGDEDRPAVGAFLGAQREPVEIVVLEVFRVDRAGPVLGLHRAQGAAGLICPGLLALELSRLAGPGLGCGRGRAALERSAVGQLPGHERRLGDARRSAPTAGRCREPFTRQSACPATLRIRPTRRRFATRTAAR
jgi:hypothetical protein